MAEVRIQMRADPVQRLGHLSRGGATVRFAPVCGSNTASFAVSKANSSVAPFAAFDAAGTLATNSCSSGFGLQFFELGQLVGVHAGALGGEVDVLVGAERLDHVDLHLEASAR